MRKIFSSKYANDARSRTYLFYAYTACTDWVVCFREEFAGKIMVISVNWKLVSIAVSF